MTTEEFQNSVEHRAKRFTPNDMGAVSPHLMDLFHAHLGLSTEVGEIGDVIKKHIVGGKPIDYYGLYEELGDLIWYAAYLANVCGWTLEDVMADNNLKLKRRYPSGQFSAHDSLVKRDKGDI